MGGTVPEPLARALQEELGLTRAVETGTFLGEGAALLAASFPEVVTVELSPRLHAMARQNLAHLRHVTVLQGDSRELLPQLVGPDPTLYWLDAHWSRGPMAGAHDQCPVLTELRALTEGTNDDCILIAAPRK